MENVYRDVKNMKDFLSVRWGPLSEYDCWDNFKSLIRDGTLSLQNDSLGVLLQTANFHGSDETIGYIIGEEVRNDEDFDRRIEELREIGINPGKQQAWFVQGSFTVNYLMDFVKEWYGAKSKRTDWNPSFAKAIKNKTFYENMKGDLRSKLEDMNQSGLIGLNYPTPRDEDEDGTDLGAIYKPRNSSSVLLPFDGWTLSECFRRHYESQR